MRFILQYHYPKTSTATLVRVPFERADEEIAP